MLLVCWVGGWSCCGGGTRLRLEDRMLGVEMLPERAREEIEELL